MRQTVEKFRGIEFGSHYKDITVRNGVEKIVGTNSMVSSGNFLDEEWLITYHCNENGELELGNYVMTKAFLSELEGHAFIKSLREKFIIHEKLSKKSMTSVDNDHDAWVRNKLLLSFSFSLVNDEQIKSPTYSFLIAYEHKL